VTGQLSYHSLSAQLPEEQRPRDEIWKIYTSGDQVIFQSFSAIYTLSGGELTSIVAPDPFLFLFEVDSRFFVEIIARGIFELKAGRLEKLVDKAAYGDSRVLSILPFGKNDLLIGTAGNGLLLYSGGTIQAWKNEINDAIKKYQLNIDMKLLDRCIVFDTKLHMIYMLEYRRKRCQQIKKSTRLQKNVVKSLQTPLRK